MNALTPPVTPPPRGRLAKAWWTVVGFGAMGVGLIGFVVPVLPSTVFFVAAAWCFTRVSSRLERWFLSLPGIGHLVDNYRAGLGMTRRAKAVSIATMWAAIGISSYLLRDRVVAMAAVIALGVIGTAVVWRHVPTTEDVLATRQSPST